MVPPIAPVKLISPAPDESVRFCSPLTVVPCRFPPAVVMLLVPASTSVPRSTRSADVTSAPFRVVVPALLVSPPLKVSTSLPSPRVTPPVFSRLTADVNVVVAPVKAIE